MNIVTALTNAVVHLVNTSGSEAGIKKGLLDNIHTATGVTPTTAPVAVPAAANTVEHESRAPGKINALALNIASRLLVTLGGNTEAAVMHILHAKGIAPKPGQKTTIVVPG